MFYVTVFPAAVKKRRRMESSRMLRRVALVWTDVSEELIESVSNGQLAATLA
jgi:hypothetical protein